MRLGRHFAQFTTLNNGESLLFGVIRAGYDARWMWTATASTAATHSGYRRYYRSPGGHNWEGKQGAQQQQGDRIGMLLDVDQGSMAVWKDDVKLGVMQAEGLSGPFCWTVVVGGQGSSVHIEPAPVPASLTEEELRSAKEVAQASVTGPPGGSGVASHGDRRRVRGGGGSAR